MADNKLLASRGFLTTLQGGKIPHESERGEGQILSGVSTAKLGMFVTRNGETAPNLALAIATDGPQWEYLANVLNMAQLLRSDPNWTIDDALPDATIKVQTFKKGCGAVVPTFLEALAGPVAIEIDDIMVLGIQAGMVQKYIYTDAAVATDTLSEKVGQAAEASAGSAADDLILLIRLVA